MTAHFILLLIAAILLFLAAIAAPLGRSSLVNIGWLGMFFWALDMLIYKQ